MSIAGSTRGVTSARSFTVQPPKAPPKFERGRIRTVKTQKIKDKDYSPKLIEVPFLFNPAELSMTKTNSWKPADGKHVDSKPLEFGGGQPRTLGLELFFDTYELHDSKQLAPAGGDVRKYTDLLLEMMKVQKDLGPEGGWPPQVMIEWGGLQKGPTWQLSCYITSMTQKFLLFAPDGTPLRATVSLQLMQADDGKLNPQNPTSGGQGNERTRLVQPGERLDLIAHQEYGDSTMWRVIADANGLLGIRDLTVGQRLAIPPRR